MDKTTNVTPPTTIRYDSALDEVRAALDAGGVIWAVNSFGSSVETLRKAGNEYVGAYDSGAWNAEASTPSLDGAFHRIRSTNAYGCVWSVEYPASAEVDHAR